MKLSQQLREEKRKLFGVTYKPKKEKLLSPPPKILERVSNAKYNFNKDIDIAVNNITAWVANENKILVKDLMSNKRYRKLVDTRHILFFLLYYSLPVTQTYIGDKFNKHHTSVIHSIKKIDALFINSLDFQKFIKLFEEFYLQEVA
jgi:chromosomal replication initiation ATPase DnaA